MNKRGVVATSAALLLCNFTSGVACGQPAPVAGTADTAALETVIETFRQSIIDPSMEAEFLDLFIAEDVTWASVYEDETRDRMIEVGKFQPLLESTYRDFYDFVKEGRYEETFHNVRVDHDESRASVDFDYAFLGDGEILNWGREYWTLLKVADEWKIASVEWTTHLQEFERCPFEASVLAVASTPIAEMITVADDYLRRMMERQGSSG